MIGQTISHYRIVAKLGGGGMGVVYAAEDLQLERSVALKFLPPHALDSEQDRQRFQREARAAAALNHPAICTIYEIAEERGMTFIAMELIEGQTLKDRLAAAPLTVSEALAIAEQIAAALAEAHAKGIVHRDVKPANIMITPTGRAKLMDFGLARTAGAARITRTGTTTGTLAYMSPEQARGEAIDRRTDLWSLGAVLYEMVTGSPPFTGEHEAAILYQIVYGDIEAPSAHAPDLPAAVEQIVTRALQKDTTQRYQTADEILADIAQAAGRSATFFGERQALLSVRLPRWQRPRRLGALIFNAALVVIVIVATAWYANRHRPVLPSSLALAVIDFQDIADPTDLNVSVGMTELVSIGLIEASPVRLVSPEFLHDLQRRLFGPDRGPIAENQALEIAQRAGATLLLSGRLTRLADRQYVTWRLVDTGTGQSLAGRRVEGPDWAHLADEIIAGVLPLLFDRSGVTERETPQPVGDLTSHSPRAFEHYVAGVIATKSSQPEQALAELRQATAVDTTFALAYFQMSRVYANLLGGTRDFARTRLYADKAWAHRDHLGIKDRMRLEAWRARVDIQDAEARSILREMLVRWPDDRETLGDYTELLYSHWYFQDALATAELGTELYTDDLDFLTFQHECLTFFGRFDEAAAVARRCTEREPERENLWQKLSAVYLQQAQPDSAEAAARRALAIDPGFVRAQIGLGHCDYVRGDLAGATVQLERIYAREDISTGARIRVLTASSFRPSLSMLYAEAGLLTEALACFDRAQELTDDPLNHVAIDGRRYRALLRLGRPAEVLAWTDSMLTNGEGRAVWFNAKMNEVAALAMVDSLAAARAAVADLLEAEATVGGLARFVALKGRVEIELTEKDSDRALQTLDEIRRNGVPRGCMFDIDVRDAEIRALRMAGRLADAVTALDELLRLHGGHAIAHYQLGQVYQQLDRAEAAAQQYGTFLTMWSRADAGLPQIADAQHQLAVLSMGR